MANDGRLNGNANLSPIYFLGAGRFFLFVDFILPLFSHWCWAGVVDFLFCSFPSECEQFNCMHSIQLIDKIYLQQRGRFIKISLPSVLEWFTTCLIGNKAGEWPLLLIDDTIWQFVISLIWSKIQSDAVGRELWLLLLLGLSKSGNFSLLSMFHVVSSLFRMFLLLTLIPCTMHVACSHFNGENIEKYSEHKILLLAFRIGEGWECIVLIKTDLISTVVQLVRFPQ